MPTKQLVPQVGCGPIVGDGDNILKYTYANHLWSFGTN